jgi:hypothetical protein
MTTWKAKREAIRQAVTFALKMPTVSGEALADGTTDLPNGVEWEGKREANRWTGPVWCDLRLGSVIALGRDEKRREFHFDGTAAGSGFTTNYGGQRSFSVMVIVGSDDQEDMEAIGEATAGLRTRMDRPEVEDMLAAVDVSVANVLPTLNVDFVAEGRQYSQSMTEVFFNTVENDEDAFPGELTGYIAEVHADGDYHSTPTPSDPDVEIVVAVTGQVVP